MCAGGFRGPKSSNRIELSRFIQELSQFFRFGFTWPWGVGQVGGWCLGWSTIVYMSSGMFRGKESSNRIELSRLVQELLNFGVLGSLRLWGVGGWVDRGGGGWGVPPTHVHMHVHACTHMHAHACMVNMIISCKWPPPLGESMGIPYDVIHTCMCVHARACVCVWGHPLTTPHPHPPTPPTPKGGTPGISQNLITLELIKIFQFCLKIWNLWRLPHPRVGGWLGGSMSGVRSNH